MYEKMDELKTLKAVYGWEVWLVRLRGSRKFEIMINVKPPFKKIINISLTRRVSITRSINLGRLRHMSSRIKLISVDVTLEDKTLLCLWNSANDNYESRDYKTHALQNTKNLKVKRNLRFFLRYFKFFTISNK